MFEIQSQLFEKVLDNKQMVMLEGDREALLSFIEGDKEAYVDSEGGPTEAFEAFVRGVSTSNRAIQTALSEGIIQRNEADRLMGIDVSERCAQIADLRDRVFNYLLVKNTPSRTYSAAA